jgi:hypothetical protein
MDLILDYVGVAFVIGTILAYLKQAALITDSSLICPAK